MNWQLSVNLLLFQWGYVINKCILAKEACAGAVLKIILIVAILHRTSAKNTALIHEL